MDTKKILEAAERARKGITELDGPLLLHFDAHKLAAAIEMECERAKEMNWSKISLHMDIPDALKLAMTLRRVR